MLRMGGQRDPGAVGWQEQDQSARGGGYFGAAGVGERRGERRTSGAGTLQFPMIVRGPKNGPKSRFWRFFEPKSSTSKMHEVTVLQVSMMVPVGRGVPLPVRSATVCSDF
jgi:hypothetical protein